MTTRITAKRLVLAGRAAPADLGRHGAAVRRYRLARLRLEDPARAHDAQGEGRPAHLHLKRMYD